MATKKIILGSVDLSDVPRKYMWYAVVTQFNYEEAYIRNLKDSVADSPLADLISEYYIPIKYTKEKVHLVDGSTKDKIHKVKGSYSNYVFVKCILTEALWNRLRTTTGAAVIPTVGGIPTPIPDEDIEKIRNTYRPEGFSEEETKKYQAEEHEKYFMFDSEHPPIDTSKVVIVGKENKTAWPV